MDHSIITSHMFPELDEGDSALVLDHSSPPQNPPSQSDDLAVPIVNESINNPTDSPPPGYTVSNESSQLNNLSHPSTLNVPYHDVSPYNTHAPQPQFNSIYQNFNPASPHPYVNQVHTPQAQMYPFNQFTSPNPSQSHSNPQLNDTFNQAYYFQPQYSSPCSFQFQPFFSSPHQTSPLNQFPPMPLNPNPGPSVSQSHCTPIAPSPMTPGQPKVQFDMDSIDGNVDNFFIRNASENNARNFASSSSGTPSARNNISPEIYHGIIRTNTIEHSPDSGFDEFSPPLRVQRAVYKKIKGQTSQMSRKFPDVLPEDRNREKYQNTGKHQMWYFILQLLGDIANKSVVVWTGLQRHFRIKDTAKLCQLWSTYNGRTSPVQWESLLRSMRTCGANGILMAVPSTKHKGMNSGVFAFVIEPSFYLNMTRQELDRFIEENCEAESPAAQHTRNTLPTRYSPY